MSERRKDHILYVIAGISVLIAVVTIASVVYYGPKLAKTDSNTEAINDGNQLTSCRAVYAAQVTGATAQLTEDKSVLDVLTSQGLRAALQQDQPNIDRVIHDAPQWEIRVLDDGKAVDMANTAYQDAAKRASADPKAFRAECTLHPPG